MYYCTQCSCHINDVMSLNDHTKIGTLSVRNSIILVNFCYIVKNFISKMKTNVYLHVHILYFLAFQIVRGTLTGKSNFVFTLDSNY